MKVRSPHPLIPPFIDPAAVSGDVGRIGRASTLLVTCISGHVRLGALTHIIMLARQQLSLADQGVGGLVAPIVQKLERTLLKPR